ncbi:MAG: DUF2079 domain-containing protein [Kiritimatiellaeota bacterium]|nr:DUF2079 domain-containing protein [Kiritimatiellota bacterium]
MITFLRRHGLLVGVMVITAVALAVITLTRHLQIASAFDLALFDSALWSFRHGNGFHVTLGCVNTLTYPHDFFGEHFAPIMYLLAWPAALTSGPQALLVLQALAIAAAAWPAAVLARRMTGSAALGTLAGCVWLAQPSLWHAALYDFHVEAFEPLFLFAFAAAFLAGNRWNWLWAVLYWACKEDAPIYFAVIATILGWHSGRRTEGTVLAALALIYAWAAWFYIIPAFSITGQPLHMSRLLTPKNCGGLWSWFVTIACDNERWMPFLQILRAMAFLPLLAGALVLPAGMSLGVMWLSANNYQSGLAVHYPLTFTPLLFLAALAGAGQVVRWMQGRSRRAHQAVCALSIALLLAGLYFGWSQAPSLTAASGSGNPHVLRESRALLECIPPDVPLTAALSLAPHLARRPQLPLLLSPSCETEWLATRLDGETYPFPNDEHFDWLIGTMLATNSDYGLVAENDVVAIFRRGAPTTANAALAFRLEHTIRATEFHHQTGTRINDDQAGGGLAWRCKPQDSDGFFIFGNYRDLPAGDYEITFRLRGTGSTNLPYARLDVSENDGRFIRAEHLLAGDTGGYREIKLLARLTGVGTAEFRGLKIGPGEIVVERVSWRRLN